MKHLEEAMKNKSGEGEGEGEQTEKKVDEDSNRRLSAEQEPSQETKKPEATEDGGAKTNPAPETKPPEANGEAKPEDKKPDEDSLKGLEVSLDSYLKGEDFGDEEMDRFMQGVKSLVDEVKAMRSIQAELKAFVDDQNAAKLEAAIDEGFEALSDDLADVFGRGAGRKIEKALHGEPREGVGEGGRLEGGLRGDGRGLVASRPYPRSRHDSRPRTGQVRSTDAET